MLAGRSLVLAAIALAAAPAAAEQVLVRSPGEATAIELEVWALPRKRFGDFIAGIPAPLCIGSVSLDDGTSVKGFLCESSGLEGANDISRFGGWRGYMGAQSQPPAREERAYAV